MAIVLCILQPEPAIDYLVWLFQAMIGSAYTYRKRVYIYKIGAYLYYYPKSIPKYIHTCTNLLHHTLLLRSKPSELLIHPPNSSSPSPSFPSFQSFSFSLAVPETALSTANLSVQDTPLTLLSLNPSTLVDTSTKSKPLPQLHPSVFPHQSVKFQLKKRISS